MNLVRVKNNNVARQAETRHATITKRLNARQRHAEGVGIVPMGGISVATEAGLNPVDAACRGRMDDAVISARTFKTKSIRRT